MSVKENLEIVKNQIINAEIKSGRKAGEVKLLAVSKFHTAEDILQAAESGQLLFGENYVQEASKKFPPILEKNPNLQLHMIGALQTNKIKKAVEIASCIQSVDSVKVLQEIEKQCAKIQKKIAILFELHTGEESKSGFTDEEELLKALDLCNSGAIKYAVPQGFMTMAPFCDDKALIRKSFVTLRKKAETFQNQFKNLTLKELSMGMSADFEIAIEEGSTMVRIGTAIFGKRDYSKTEK